MVYDFFKNQQHIHRDSYDDQGGMILLNMGVSNCAACWAGDGNILIGASQFNPLSHIDVVAHEFGHGITDTSPSDLDYYSESGALDESYADIYSACVQNFVNQQTGLNNNIWHIDNHISGPGSAFPIRSMENPKREGNPDTYKGTLPGSNWYYGGSDYAGVHTNSGVQNYWFYLLSEGSSSTDGVNNHGDAFHVQGIGMDKALRIAYATHTQYLMRSSSNYRDARDLSIEAAKDIYGPNSQEAKSTKDAWYAVGVWLPPQAPTRLSVTPFMGGTYLMTWDALDNSDLSGTTSLIWNIPGVYGGTVKTWNTFNTSGWTIPTSYIASNSRYRLRLQDQFGRVVYSPWVSLNDQLKAPTNLNISSSIRLTWRNNNASSLNGETVILRSIVGTFTEATTFPTLQTTSYQIPSNYAAFTYKILLRDEFGRTIESATVRKNGRRAESQLEITSLDVEKEFQIRPNPASHLLFIDGLGADTSYIVQGVSGNVVLEGVTNADFMEGQMAIDVSTLAEGIYILNMDSKKVRFLVQH